MQLRALDVALTFTRHPGLRWRALNLKYTQAADLPSLAKQYGIHPDTPGRLARARIDYPGYRFHRDARFYDYFAANSHQLQGVSWLDVGADTGAVDVYLSEMLNPSQIELCDISVAPKRAYPVRQIAGTHLDYETNAFDVVFFTYVLHHAADSTIQLLKDAHRIARRHVVVLEDPKETNADYYWAYKHDRRGTFRGLKEWRDLFAALDFSISHEAALANEIHSRHLFILDPISVAAG